MRRIKFAAALAALGLISSAATAADLPYYGAPARSGSYMWQGPYVGANLGYRFYAHHLNRYYTCDWMLSSS